MFKIQETRVGERYRGREEEGARSEARQRRRGGGEEKREERGEGYTESGREGSPTGAGRTLIELTS